MIDDNDSDSDSDSDNDNDNDRGAAPPKATADRATPLRVITVGALLAITLALTGFLARPPAKDITVEEAHARWFQSVEDPVPFGLVAVEARTLPGREKLLRYVSPTTIAQGPDATAPLEFTLIEYPAARGEAVLADQFTKLRFDSGKSGMGGGSDGGRGSGRRSGGGRGGGRAGSGGSGGDGDEPPPKLRDSGFVDWDGYQSNFARLRHSLPAADAAKTAGAANVGDAATKTGEEPGLGEGQSDPQGDEAPGGPRDDSSKPATPFYETIRVNLSTGGRCLIGYLRFQVGVEGSRDALETLLASLQPVKD